MRLPKMKFHDRGLPDRAMLQSSSTNTAFSCLSDPPAATKTRLDAGSTFVFLLHPQSHFDFHPELRLFLICNLQSTSRGLASWAFARHGLNHCYAGVGDLVGSYILFHFTYIPLLALRRLFIPFFIMRV